jgi:predicted nuclease of predicted toxin-antitoxin system
MRLLIDANLSMVVAHALTAAGYDATHVAHHGMDAASDLEIAAFAEAHGAAVVSADSDFATLLALSGHTAPSLILLRSADALSPREQAGLLIANLPAVAEELSAGAVVSLSARHLRVRRLPLPSAPSHRPSEGG